METLVIIIILIILLTIIFKIESCNKYDQINIFKILKVSNNEITNQLTIENKSTIPNIIFQTYYDKSKIPQYIFDNIKKYGSNYDYILYDDIDAIKFLEHYYSKEVVDTFKRLNLGAHKADLLRYCFLYINGGIYLDIKTILIKPLDEIFIDKTYFYSALSSVRWLYQGIIASPPRNTLFLHLITKIVKAWTISIKINYLIFCKDIYKKIQSDTINKKIKQGLNIGVNNNYYLFEEKCNKKTTDLCPKLDRYGKCCSIYDKGELIFITRDPNFPW